MVYRNNCWRKKGTTVQGTPAPSMSISSRVEGAKAAISSAVGLMTLRFPCFFRLIFTFVWLITFFPFGAVAQLEYTETLAELSGFKPGGMSNLCCRFCPRMAARLE